MLLYLPSSSLPIVYKKVHLLMTLPSYQIPSNYNRLKIAAATPFGIYLLKVNNRNTIFRTYFTPCSSVSTVNFEHVNADWDTCHLRIAPLQL